MNTKTILLGVVLLCTNFSYGQKEDKKLLKLLHSVTDTFHGTIGIYVENLKTKKTASVHADTIFPTASIVKVPILVTVYDQILKGKLHFDEPLIYSKTLKYGGSGLMQYFQDSTPTTIAVATSLMIGYSDNTASLWLQSLAGGSDSINALMEKIGLAVTRDNSRTHREKERAIYGWGQTTPREMATLLKYIFEKSILTPAACNSIYRTMTNVYYDNYALSEIPPYVQAASKQGMVDASRSELALVNAPHGDYVFYIATKNNADKSWTQRNEAWQMIRKISALLWNYFEPKSGWKPAASSAEFLEK